MSTVKGVENECKSLSETPVISSKIIEKEMYGVSDSDLHSFSTPLTVDINSGDNWGILH